MKPLQHRTQNQTDADAERIGFLIELHCVLELVLQCCSITNRIGGTVLLWIFMSPTPPSNTGYLHRDLGEPGRVGNDTQCANR